VSNTSHVSWSDRSWRLYREYCNIIYKRQPITRTIIRPANHRFTEKTRLNQYQHTSHTRPPRIHLRGGGRRSVSKQLTGNEKATTTRRTYIIDVERMCVRHIIIYIPQTFGFTVICVCFFSRSSRFLVVKKPAENRVSAPRRGSKFEHNVLCGI